MCAIYKARVDLLVIKLQIQVVKMFVDDSLADEFVEFRVLCPVQPDEVRRSVVELVAVKMVADLIGPRHAPERRADELVDSTVFAGNHHLGIRPMHIRLPNTLGRIKSRLENLAFGVSDVAERVGVIRFSADDFRRHLFDNWYIHNRCIFTCGDVATTEMQRKGRGLKMAYPLKMSEGAKNLLIVHNTSYFRL